jgi:signal transduction histidine kinase
LLPLTALATPFGRSGLSVVVDEQRDSILYASGADVSRTSGAPRAAWRARPRGSSDSAAFSDIEGDSVRLASLVRLPDRHLAVMSIGTIGEFSGPFAAAQASSLTIVVLASIGIAAAFVLLLWRGTRPLVALTAAADEVGRGNLDPALPAAADDEVGRLAAAFSYMLDRIRAMIRETERSRQMAAIGEFASQISHEIRNPLTSIKLNLQRFERAASAGTIPTELHRPLQISLAELQRLDRVVRGVLQLGRPTAEPRVAFALADVVGRAIEASRAQMEAARIEVVLDDRVGAATVRGDPELLQAAVGNLLLNAVDAMPGGGRVHVVLEAAGASRARLRVEDDGPGISPPMRDRIFAPFFTTKSGGSGLGLAIAQRGIEAHEGTIAAADPSLGRGAAFVIDLPLFGGAQE